MSIICVSGVPGSGKTTLAKAVSTHIGCAYGSFGGYVRHCAKRRGLTADRATLQQLGQDLVVKSPRQFCEAVIGWLKWQPGSELLLDGLRHESVLDAMIEAVRPTAVRLLYVDVSADTQRSRLRERDATSDIAGLMSDVTERDVQTKLRARADFIVRGEGRIEAIVAQVSTWMQGNC